MKLGEICDKVQQIISVCKEEVKEHRHRVRELERKHHVKFDSDEECMVMTLKKEDYPQEQATEFPFDPDEWCDGAPATESLKNLNMEWFASHEKMAEAVRIRCKLLSVEEDEFSVIFVVDKPLEYVNIIGDYWQTDWKNFGVEFNRKKKGD
jgi:hypothetical protein